MATYYKYSVKSLDEDIATRYEKGELEFDYISPENFKKIKKNSKPRILGSIKLKETKKENCDIVTITSNYKTYNFELLDKKDNVKGYIKVDKDTYVSIVKNNYIIVIILLLLLIVIGSYVAVDKLELFGNSNKEGNIVDDNPKIDKEDGEDIQEQKPVDEEVEQESIAIPGYVDLKVSSNNPEVYLTNPEGNRVYFKYTLKEGDKVIYQTKAFEPGKMVRVNLKNLLSVGEHKLIFIIETYDLETEAPCNGANQEVRIFVKE